MAFVQRLMRHLRERCKLVNTVAMLDTEAHTCRRRNPPKESGKANWLARLTLTPIKSVLPAIVMQSQMPTCNSFTLMHRRVKISHNCRFNLRQALSQGHRPVKITNENTITAKTSVGMPHHVGKGLRTSSCKVQHILTESTDDELAE